MILLMEGFDNIGPNDYALKGWNSAFSAMVLGRFGYGQACTTASLKMKTLVDNTGAVANSGSTVFMQVGYKCTDTNAAQDVIIFQTADGGTVQFTLTFVHGPDVFKLYRGDRSGGTLVATSSQVSLAANLWKLIEMMVTISPSSGAVAVKLNGSQVLSASGLNTQASGNAYVNKVGFGGGGAGSNDAFDDFIVFDSTGSSVNSFLGDKSIVTSFPIADGAHTDFTPTTGTAHWSTVDETTPNASDGVTSQNAGTIDTYGITPLTLGTTILAIQLNAAVSKNASQTRTCATVVRQGSTDYFGPNRDVPASPAFVQTLLSQNPATNAAWQTADINSGQVGLKLVA